jgi:hypothetical protein
VVSSTRPTCTIGDETIVATHEVRLRFDTLVDRFDLARAVLWTVTPHYAARNDNWCGKSDCSCEWIVWPACDLRDWIIVGVKAIEFVREV